MRALHVISGIRKTLSFKVISIAIAWIAGLFAGCFLLTQTPFASLMCSVLFLRISIFGLFISLAFPLLLSYILLRFFRFSCILPFAFVKAFSFICSFGGIMIAFGNAGWLVSWMILFSDFFLVVILLFQWFSAATGKRYKTYLCIVVYCLIPILIGCFDYFVVSPYAAMLLNY